jgi:hypothetical protein
MNSVDLTAVRWSKSSHSGGESGDCVEIAVLTSADTASL